MDGFGNRSQYKDWLISGLLLLVSAGCHNIKEPSSKLDFSDAASAKQLLTGFWWLESGSWRWTSKEFSAALKPPDDAERSGARLSLHLYIPEFQIRTLGAMTLTAEAGGRTLESETYSQGGNYVYTRDVPKDLLETSLLPVKFSFDKAVPADKGDGRELAAIVTEIDLESD